MGDEETRRCRLPRSQAETTRRRQVGLVDGRNDDCQALRAKTFLDGAEGLARPCRLDDDKPRGIEAKAQETCCRRHTELACKRSRPAPQHPRPDIMLNLPVFRQSVEPANGKPHGKANPCHPVGRRRTSEG